MDIKNVRLKPEILQQHGFCAEDWEGFACDDTPVAKYRGYTIALSIPNGGILGVSFFKKSSEECYSLLTEGVENAPGYDNQDGHIALAKAAIDASIDIRVVAEQLELDGVEA